MRRTSSWFRSALALLLVVPTAVSAWAEQKPAVTAHLTAKSVVVTDTREGAISPGIYGVNNNWDEVSAEDFPVFADTLSRIGYAAMRYPGGWESEYLDWHANRTPGWNLTPARAGVGPSSFRAMNHQSTYVLPSQLYNDGRVGLDQMKAIYADIIETYGGSISVFEIGNEWWLQSGAQRNPAKRARIFARYAELVGAMAPYVKSLAPSAQVFATIDWRDPQQAAALRSAAGPGWAAVDGISIHSYCGDQATITDCGTLDEVAKKIETLGGKRMVYSSEWTAARRLTGNKFGLQAANLVVQAFGEMARGGVRYAAYWPTTRAIPSLALVSDDLRSPTAVGLAFSQMRTHFEGEALKVEGDLPALAAHKSGGGLSVVVPTFAAGRTTVEVRLPTGRQYHLKSASVVVATAPFVANKGEVRMLKVDESSGAYTFEVNADAYGWQIAFLDFR